VTNADGDLDRGATGALDRWKRVDWAGAGILMTAAFALRGLTWPAVFTADGIRLVGPDAHYHLRRILWSVENFPAVLSRDPYLRFPDGGESIWTPAFDAGIATLARLLVGTGDSRAVETVAVWVPPALGALTVLVVYAVGRRTFGRLVGWMAGGILCILPPHVAYSQVGFVDHHAAVALLTAVLLGGTLSLVRPGSEPEVEPRVMPRAPMGIVLGAAMGAGLLVWPGSLLQVGVVQVCAIVWILVAGETTTASRRATGAVVAHGTAFLIVAPFAIGNSGSVWGPASPVVLSAFQPLWLGLPALGLGVCVLTWRAGIGAGSQRRRAVSLATFLGLPALACLAFPDLRDGVTDALGWFFRAESFQAVVAESLPLFSDGRGFSPQRAHAQLTPLIYALPVMLVVLALTSQRSACHRVVAFWAVILFAATLAQYRFANSFSVVWALTIACSVDLGLRLIANLAPAARAAIGTAAVILGAALVVPIASSHGRALGTAERALAGEVVRPRERVTHHRVLVDAASWLGEHSPTTEGWLEADASPAYGVLTAWGDGHVMRYVARRPVVQDNFGDDLGRKRFDQAEQYFAADTESEALRVAEDLRVRYVLVRATGSGHAPAPYGSRSMLVRMHRLGGSAGSLRPGDQPEARSFVPALSRHRLLYESPAGIDRERGRYKIFEIVKGALVVGQAPPGALVEARLQLSSDNSSDAFEYRAHVRAGSDGHYELRLPYPTEAFVGRFTAARVYRLRSGDQLGALAIDEAEVQSGARREGPDLVP
jgi:dolichyl-diphosphooligosaccharide--protein glycosyltransferase